MDIKKSIDDEITQNLFDSTLLSWLAVTRLRTMQRSRPDVQLHVILGEIFFILFTNVPCIKLVKKDSDTTMILLDKRRDLRVDTSSRATPLCGYAESLFLSCVIRALPRRALDTVYHMIQNRHTAGMFTEHANIAVWQRKIIISPATRYAVFTSVVRAIASACIKNPQSGLQIIGSNAVASSQWRQCNVGGGRESRMREGGVIIREIEVVTQEQIRMLLLKSIDASHNLCRIAGDVVGDKVFDIIYQVIVNENTFKF